ncbi:hypothetical protein ACWGH8_04985 [Nonomuraea muscovyensis]|uniref:Uncharacterized protein n=1 Tax=Nonomuraea muscovyensis TaxID=1124761 RepID=A0A7X0C309_9ACTN|nr:hypothetical protein [Nonomuraea muscovyensis]MBB6347620.1 hypothetical protein [Nonomuraea muscovyensis]
MSGEAEMTVSEAIVPAAEEEQPAGQVAEPDVNLVAVFAKAKRLNGTWPLFARGLDPAVETAWLRSRYRMVAVCAARRSVHRGNIEAVLAGVGLLAMCFGGLAVLIGLFWTDWWDLVRMVVAIGLFIPVVVWGEKRRDGGRFLGGLTDALITAVAVGCFPAALYVRYADGPAWVVDLKQEWWMSAVQGIGTFAVTILIATLPVMAVNWLADRGGRTPPTEVLFEQLTMILTHLEPGRRGQLAPEARREILAALGKTASVLRTGMPAAALGGTQLTRAVVRARAVEASHAITDLQLWIALPSTTSHEDFRARICDLLRTVLTGEYDKLPVRETTPETVRRAWHARVLDGTRTLVIAALPLTALFITHRLGLTLPAPYDAGASIVASAWAIILVLGWLDPNFSTHLSAARDMTALNPFSRGSNNNQGG